jgi:hypothetical protein
MHHQVRHPGLLFKDVDHLIAKLDRRDHPQMQHNRETTSPGV